MLFRSVSQSRYAGDGERRAKEAVAMGFKTIVAAVVRVVLGLARHFLLLLEQPTQLL